MKIDINRYLHSLMIVLLAISSSEVVAAGADFGMAVGKSYERSDYAVIVDIRAGKIIGGPDVDCGSIYDAVIVDRIKGSLPEVTIRFFSEVDFNLGSRYVLFLHRRGPYSLPDGMTALDDGIEKRKKICTQLIEGDAPNLTTGMNPITLELVNDNQSVAIDTLRFRVSNSLLSRVDDISHCESDQQSLQPKDCLLVTRRTLVSLSSILDLMNSGRSD